MVRSPDAGDSHVEELLDRFSDVDLRRFRMHSERVLTAILIGRRGLLGDDRSDDGSSQCRHGYLPFFFLPADFLADVFFALLAAALGFADLFAALAAFLAVLWALELLV